jgi:hypothetical protein
MGTIALPDRFIATFTLLAGTAAELDALPACALALVGRASATPNEPGSDRFCRGLLAAHALTAGERGILSTACRRALSLDPSASLEQMLGAASLFDSYSTESLLRLLPGLYDQRRDRALVLQLALCTAVPDRETFAHCAEAVLVDALDLDDDEVRAALHAVWPGSMVWDHHRAEIASLRR